MNRSTFLSIIVSCVAAPFVKKREVNPMSLLKDEQRFTAEQIARIYKVPPSILGNWDRVVMHGNFELKADDLLRAIERAGRSSG